MLKFKRMFLLGAMIAAVGLIFPACEITVVEPDRQTYVRFSWKVADQADIVAIAASYSDVKYWYQTYYNRTDATDIPIFRGEGGSSELPNYLYSSEIRSTVNNNAKWFPISVARGDDATQYTAVCTAEDQYGYIDIVANYYIYSYEYMKYDYYGYGEKYLNTEIAFDVGTLLDGYTDSDWLDEGWFYGITDNRSDWPRLSKAQGKGLVKTVEKDNVTYYVLRRPKP